MPLVEDLVEGLTTEPTLVHSEATTDPNCGKATSSHPSDFQETAVERSADTPLKPSSEVKDETALPEARSFWRLARMKKGDKRPSFSSSKNALSHMSPCTLPVCAQDRHPTGFVKRGQRQVSALAVNVRRLLRPRSSHDD